MFVETCCGVILRVFSMSFETFYELFSVLLTSSPKKLENAKISFPPKGQPNNRWPRSAWLTKVVGGVGGAIVNTFLQHIYIDILHHVTPAI